MRKVLLFSLLFCTAILGYGWWHASTHASFHGGLRLLPPDRSGIQGPVMPGAHVRFLDASGELLAEGINDQRDNYLHLLHPDMGDCHDFERAAAVNGEGRKAWRACYEKLSMWTSSWIRKVRQVAVAFDDCAFPPMPAEAREYFSDWYLWWVPLPHVGGRPYTHYSLGIEVDPAACVVPKDP